MPKTRRESYHDRSPKNRPRRTSDRYENPPLRDSVEDGRSKRVENLRLGDTVEDGRPKRHENSRLGDTVEDGRPKKRPPNADRRRSRGPEPEDSPRKLHSEKHKSASSSARSSNVLSIDSLAKLDALNEKSTKVRDREQVDERRHKERVTAGPVAKEKGKHRRRSDRHGKSERREKRRVISGPLAEEGKIGRRRGGYVGSDSGDGKARWKLWLAIGSVVLLLAILIPVGIVLSKKKGKDNGGGSGGGNTDSSDPSNNNLNGISENDIPTSAKGSILDPFTWYDTTDFNVTYTDEMVGGLPIMGLNSTWNDTGKANEFVPSLDKDWAYGTMPIRGVNLGGWLSIEPFITPSMFNSYKSNQGIVDEYTLCGQLGPAESATVLEKHYAQFINEQTFQEVQAAGFDHVRIPFSYWAVTTYPGDPYVPQISWRYLLRGIEYARKYGLRVNLDLHALPGSQNGWNHSGRQGAIGWLNGTDGALNAQRSLDLHTQLATFFAQPRYRNVIAIYGLVNEPRMSALDVGAVVAWTTSAVQTVRKCGLKQTIAFGDGFLGLPKWQGKLQGLDGLVLDAHQYVIFNPDQISFTHQKKIQYACSGWSGQMKQSMDISTG